ncbi:hypothetical protein GHT07_06105 [Caenimonas koreensis DSM 17982]|uniref:phosphoribosylglycinamide formyltransferase 1 n=1 Tax=Caenimonas koreensis DSM 17982 TaxID=1121255 RepID=A0A844AR79_9BURK|nr:formyl transferase [Caenimonas koreensis]MRD46840.1 hypothetical protein [Caenimonas koreensis DSM 17982]
MSDVRALVLCCDGFYQTHILQQAARHLHLVGFVLYKGMEARQGLLRRMWRYADPRALVRQLQARFLLKGYEPRLQAMQREVFHEGGQPPTLPDSVPHLVTQDINSVEVADFIRRMKPDIVLVNGTQLLRAPILELIAQIPLGIINLHTGLSPYSRGGNCNLFMLLEGHPELVGVTVHHIDAGIDSGDIILSAQVPILEGDTFEMIDARSFHLGAQLLVRAAQQLAAGRAARVKQWEAGKLFLKRTGYVYEPYHRLAANRLLDRGLAREYLANKASRDAGVRTIGAAP